MSLKYLFSKSAISKQHSRNFEIIKGSTVGLRNSLMKVKIVNVTIAQNLRIKVIYQIIPYFVKNKGSNYGLCLMSINHW